MIALLAAAYLLAGYRTLLLVCDTRQENGLSPVGVFLRRQYPPGRAYAVLLFIVLIWPLVLLVGVSLRKGWLP